MRGGIAAVAGAGAGAQTEAARRGVRRVGLVGSLQQPPQVWLGTPPLLLLQVVCPTPPLPPPPAPLPCSPLPLCLSKYSMHVATVYVFMECQQPGLVYSIAGRQACLYQHMPFCVPCHTSVALHMHIMLHHNRLASCSACFVKTRIYATRCTTARKCKIIATWLG